MTTRWNKLNPKKSIKCNCFNRPFAAMYGCEGRATHWRYGVYNMGRQSIDYGCATCMAVEERHAKMTHPEHQAELLRVQAESGVENYRFVKTAWIDGRPQLVRD